MLRGPLEDKNVTISRLYSKVIYPSNFMLIASMNPCPCGYYGSTCKGFQRNNGQRPKKGDTGQYNKSL